MSDNLFSAVLTFSLLAAGTIAVGSEMVAPRQAATTERRGPAADGDRGRQAHRHRRRRHPADGRRHRASPGRHGVGDRRHRPRLARPVRHPYPRARPRAFQRPPSGGRFLCGAAPQAPLRCSLADIACSSVSALSARWARLSSLRPGRWLAPRIRSSSARAWTRTMLRVSARLAAPGRSSSAGDAVDVVALHLAAQRRDVAAAAVELAPHRLRQPRRTARACAARGRCRTAPSRCFRAAASRPCRSSSPRAASAAGRAPARTASSRSGSSPRRRRAHRCARRSRRRASSAAPARR